MRVIVAISGGKASAWCADWAFKHYDKKDIILYFYDTKWEHPDLYRFLNDLSKYFDHPITYDTDGRSPEILFYEQNALATDRMAFCSRILKAERLQKYYKHGDILIFGIGRNEKERALRIIDIYVEVVLKQKKCPKLVFPLIKEDVTDQQIDSFIKNTGIEQPLLYRLGFTHNNCSGGCVRGGRKQWKLLYDKLPEVYLDRERVEREMRAYTGKDIKFLKDITLEEFRSQIERNELTPGYDEKVMTECIGICSTFS